MKPLPVIMIAGTAAFLLTRKTGFTPFSNQRSDGGGTIDPYADKDLQTECDPSEKPGVQQFRSLILRLFKGTDLGISRACDEGGISEHKEGRAWDWAAPNQEAINNCFLMLFGNGNEIARRAGLMYVLSNGRIWRSYSQGGSERGTFGPMTKAEDPHKDHVHFSFSRAGAAGETSLYNQEIV